MFQIMSNDAISVLIARGVVEIINVNLSKAKNQSACVRPNSSWKKQVVCRMFYPLTNFFTSSIIFITSFADVSLSIVM